MNNNNSYINILKEKNIKCDILLKNIELHQLEYPIYKISIHTGIVVRFDSLTTGDVVYPGDKKYISRVGWIVHSNSNNWRNLTYEEYHKYVVLEGLAND